MSTVSSWVNNFWLNADAVGHDVKPEAAIDQSSLEFLAIYHFYWTRLPTIYISARGPTGPRGSRESILRFRLGNLVFRIVEFYVEEVVSVRFLFEINYMFDFFGCLL